MPNYRIGIEYDGAAFHGWQAQAGGQSTVQGALVEAVERVTGERVAVSGSGRTDAGVHAEAQVASFRLQAEWDPLRLQRALNGVLPPAVAVGPVEQVSDSFDALRSAVGKRYRYRIWNGPQRSPLRAARQVHVPKRLDVACMQAAATALVGEHDFASFQASGSDVVTSVRRLTRLDVRGDPSGEIEIVAEGTGFLRHMVRNLAGTLIEVGHGKRSPGSMAALLAAACRDQAGPTAPAHGLTLEQVHYPDASE